jgi:hypothetical protein
MWLTGVILFIGAVVLFGFWGYKFYYLRKYKTLVTKEDLEIESMKGISIFIAIAIFAGMAWG